MKNKDDPKTRANHYKKERLRLVKEIGRLNHDITRKIEELTEVIVLEHEAKREQN